jgi:DNA-binding winged helix-turn-helix (wHTH) protein/tetratricopeptide (TPR) repeat protein
LSAAASVEFAPVNVAPPLRFIDLTKVEPFRIGALQIQPSTCEARWPGGRETLQPRVMKVLVALNERRGEVLSHGDLILSCWEGRVVGEDAIQRCIALLRQLGAQTGAFAIETVPRIGYRLDSGEPQRARPGRRFRQTRKARLVVPLAACAAVLVAAAWLLLRPDSRPPGNPAVAIQPLEAVGGEPAQAFAASLRGDIVDVLRQSRVEMPGAASPDGLILDGTVTRGEHQLEAHLQLKDAQSGTLLWSKGFAGGEDARDRLATEASVALAQNVSAIRDTRMQPGYVLDPKLVALYVRGAELVRSPQLLDEGTPRETFESVVAQAPGFAAGHAMLSLAYVNEARSALPENRAAWERKARAEAAKAIAIDPASSGAAYDALYLAARTLHPRDLVTAERALDDGLRNAGGFAYLSMRKCRLLSEVGRANEALAYCQRAIALAPFAEPIAHSYALALDVAGQAGDASEVIDRAARNSPDHGVTRLVRLELAMFGGRGELARKLLDDSATRPQFMGPDAVSAARRYLQHAGKWRRAEQDSLAADIVQSVRDDQMSTDIGVLMLASIGGPDQAFQLLDSPSLDRFLFVRGTVFLFQPAAGSLRADPRFWAAAARLGLAQYWASTGKWPDICGRELPLARCKAEAAKALRQ